MTAGIDGNRTQRSSGLLALVAALAAMLKLTRNIPKKMNGGGLEAFSGQLPFPTISSEYSAAMRRLEELEEKVIGLSRRPLEMPCDKEEMLNDAVSRLDVLEAGFSATRKSLEESLARQDEIIAYIEKQKKRRRMMGLW